MSKKLDVTKITNDLKGRSAHFYRPSAPSSPPLASAQQVERIEELPVIAVPFVENPETKEENVSKETKKQVTEETSLQVSTETLKQVSKETRKQGNKPLKRYATYLSEEAILAMQKIAFETRRKDYEVFQEAVEKYIKRNAS